MITLVTLYLGEYVLNMSTKAKMTLAGTAAGALGIIVFVHYAQQAEKAVRLRCPITTVVHSMIICHLVAGGSKTFY